MKLHSGKKLLSMQGFLPASFLVFVFCLSVIVFFSRANAATRDAKRVSDLSQTQQALEFYYKKCGYYPGAIQAQDVCALWIYTGTWSGMKTALVSSRIGVADIPNDPLPDKNYFYSVGRNGQDYVIGAQLEEDAGQYFTRSAHGILNGIDCNDSVYCVRVSK